MQVNGDQLSRVVRIVGQLIQARETGLSTNRFNEGTLRRELVACVLSSQVTSDAASRAVLVLTRAGLLKDERWARADLHFEWQLAHALHSCSYRFPRAKARQLAEMRSSLLRRPLADRIKHFNDPAAIRDHLASELPGVGPKQASMFLRNVRWTFDLAILDVHVLNFLFRVGLTRSVPAISSLRQYLKVEEIARDYAATLGQRVGTLDWAIWITMRAARELRV